MDKYAVIGNPVAHSLSPTIHREFAKQTHQNIDYQLIEAPLDQFRKTVEQFRDDGGLGANVTIPFKQEAYHITSFRSNLAEQAQAVNTLRFEDNRMYAYNTDGLGLIKDLAKNLNYSIRGKRVLILGAGGAARGIITPLLLKAPHKLVIANRTMKKAVHLAHLYQLLGPIRGIGLEELRPKPFDLIINATSTGISGELLALPPEIIGPQTWCYDLMYNNKGTPFLEWAKNLNAEQCIDGLGMLVEQAAESFYLWRQIHPETQTVIDLLRSTK